MTAFASKLLLVTLCYIVLMTWNPSGMFGVNAGTAVPPAVPTTAPSALTTATSSSGSFSWSWIFLIPILVGVISLLIIVCAYLYPPRVNFAKARPVLPYRQPAMVMAPPRYPWVMQQYWVHDLSLLIWVMQLCSTFDWHFFSTIYCIWFYIRTKICLFSCNFLCVKKLQAICN